MPAPDRIVPTDLRAGIMLQIAVCPFDGLPMEQKRGNRVVLLKKLCMERRITE